MVTCPNLKYSHKMVRMQYARNHMSWTSEWNKVVFSDEKKFNLDGPDGYHGYWRDLRKDPLYFSKRNFGGGSVMIWGAFCSSGKLDLEFISAPLDSVTYQGVLRKHLVPFLKKFRRQDLVFQQDNATCHVSRSTTAFLDANNIQVMKWPACSPDVNPIENMWGILVRSIYKDNRQYQTVNELKCAILDAWQSISQETIDNLINSMPNRIFDIITNRGGYINY